MRFQRARIPFPDTSSHLSLALLLSNQPAHSLHLKAARKNNQVQCKNIKQQGGTRQQLQWLPCTKRQTRTNQELKTEALGLLRSRAWAEIRTLLLRRSPEMAAHQKHEAGRVQKTWRAAINRGTFGHAIYGFTLSTVSAN